MTDFDIAIIGSGFGGSLLAQIALSLNLRVILIERGRHPRFAIGESTSPLMNLLLEDMGRRYSLPHLLPLCAYGTWLESYPGVVRGLKRGFTFYTHADGQPFAQDSGRDRQLLVAASPHNSVADTHWLRSDVDAFLKDGACRMGAEYIEEAEVLAVSPDESASALTVRHNGIVRQVTTRLIVDASGPRGAVSRFLAVPEAGFPGYPATSALFTHFTGVAETSGMPEFIAPDTPPYPPDSAALHHLFADGWIWVLRFDNGVTSAGAAIRREAGERLGEGAAGWAALLERFPSVRDQFAGATACEPWRSQRALTYRAARSSGPGWTLLPGAAAFIDPMFSTGMPLTLLGIERLARLLEGGLPLSPDQLAGYEAVTLAEADWTATFIGACYAALPDFKVFRAFSMFYFAAASYSEIARRLGSPRVTRYLCADQPAFAAALMDCADAIHSGAAAADIARFEERCATGIESLNIAGLCSPARRNWYPVDLDDVVRSAGKLCRTPAAMRKILDQADWARITV